MIANDTLDTTAVAPIDDHTLIRSARGGDDGAAEILFRRYAARLRAIVAARSPKEFSRRFDSDDVVQSAFRVFFEGIHSKHYDVAMDAEIWGLLTVLALNKLRDKLAHHRAAKRSVYLTAGDSEQAFAEYSSGESDTAAALEMIIEEYFASIPASTRDVIALRMSGYSIGEIVLQTGQNLRAVERILQNVRAQLKDLLSN